MELNVQAIVIIFAFALLQEFRVSHSKTISGKISGLEKELADMVGKFDVDDADKPQTYNDKPQTYNDKPQTYNDKPQTYNDKPQTYNDKSQTYNDKPQTYNDKPQTYNDKPQTYNDLIKELQTYSNDKPRTYEDKLQTFLGKKRNYVGLLKEDEALMKAAIEASTKEKKSLEGFVPSEDDKTLKDIKAELTEFMKDVSTVHKREHHHSWGKGKVEVPDELPAPPKPKDDNKEKRMDDVTAAILKKLREMRKRGMKLPRTTVDKLTKYVARKRSEKDSIPPHKPGERPDWPEAPSDAKVEDILMTRLANKLDDISKRGMEIPDKMVDILGKYLSKRRLNKRISKGH